MTDVLNHRPRGDLQVDYYRPPMRFSNAISIGVVTETDGAWTPILNGSGDMEWHRLGDGIVQHPFMYLDDDMAVEIMRAIQREPIRTRSDLTIDHLHDTIRQRDRVMDLLENTLERQHTIDLRSHNG